MRRELERVEVPGEHETRERTWKVLSSAFAGRQPVERPHPRARLVISIAVVAAILAAVVSPPGQAVLDEIRDAVGVERPQPALFSLPSGGKLLVASDAGVWVVQQDGSKRLLGPYREASWSPFGRFVAATTTNELAALEPDGGVRWTLARPGITSPRWTGTETDTRIAYVDRTGIRLVAGDGKGDRLLVPGARARLAWRPGAGFVLAYASAREVRVLDVDTGRTLWQAARRPAAAVTTVEWSADGQRLLVLSPRSLEVYDGSGRIVDRNDPAEGWPDVDASFQPGTHRIAIARVHGSQSSVFGTRARFNGFGEFREVAWSPEGRWLLVSWPTADQWVFVHAGAGKRISAVANVSEQFRSRSFPRVDGWCCAG